MIRRAFGCIACVAALAAAGPAFAQEGPTVRKREFTLDLNAVGVSVGFAGRKGPRGIPLGGELGVGGDFLSLYWVHGLGTICPGYCSRQMGEVVRGAAFVRIARSAVTTDIGIRASLSLYDDQGGHDDIPTSTFVGAYVTPLFGSHRVRVGARIQAGYFDMQGSREPRTAVRGFGVAFSPLTVRLTFP